MPPTSPQRALGVLVVVTIAGCSMLIPGPELAGGRRWIIPVENQSSQPAALVVAEDTGSVGPVLGRVVPRTVPPHSVVDVTFDIPPGGTWAIFVNPGRPDEGPLITAADVPPDAVGRLPITIFILPNGQSSVEAPGAPGWFGN